jgi:hypothetical protein
MAESFITVLHGVITSKQHGNIGEDFFGTSYYGHEKIKVPFEAIIYPHDLVEFYTSDWVRKSDCQLIDERLISMPEGYVREGDNLRPMTQEERVLTRLDDPPHGYKVVGGEIVPLTLEEKVDAGEITEEDYNKRVAEDNNAELQRRLAELQTPEALAQAEVDEEYAIWRKTRLVALLAVKQQSDWPIIVEWPV